MIKFPKLLPRIDRNVVGHFMGYPALYPLPQAIKEIIDKEIASAIKLVEPVGGFEILTISETNHFVAFKEVSVKVKKLSFFELLSEADKISLFVVSIGPKIEEKLEEYKKTKERSKYLVLDAVGSAAVECLARQAEKELEEIAYRTNFYVTPRITPALGLAEKSIRRDVFKLITPEIYGIRVTPDFHLIPRKSIVGILGWSREWKFIEKVERHL